MFKFNPFKSMTLLGTVSAVGAYLYGHFDPAGLSPTASTIVQAAGAIIGVLGLRNAIAKNGSQQ